MKKLGELLKLKSKKLKEKRGAIDEKIAESVFWRILEDETDRIGRADIKTVQFFRGKLTVRAFHPAIANEIWRRREKLRKKMNEMLDDELIEELKVK